MFPRKKTKIIEKSELVVSYEDVNPQEVANIGTTHEITADNQPDLKSISLESIALDGTILATKADAKTTTILQWDGKNWKPLKIYSLDKPFPTFPLFVINKNDIRVAFYDPATKKTNAIYKFDSKTHNFLPITTAEANINITSFVVGFDGTMWATSGQGKWYQWVEGR